MKEFRNSLKDFKIQFNLLIDSNIKTSFKLWSFAVIALMFINVSSLSAVGFLKIKGCVLIRDKYLTESTKKVYSTMDNAKIDVFCNDALIDSKATEGSGTFELHLDWDKEYVVEINKKGFVSKRFLINAYMPKYSERNNVYSYKLSVSIFPYLPEIDYSLLSEPVAVISYYSDRRSFYFNYEEAEKINKKVLELENIVDITLQIQKDRYENLLESGQKFLSASRYLDALQKYSEAAQIYPEEKYPRQKIADITALLNKSGLYQTLIYSADSLYYAGQYPDALKIYRKALSIKPKENYPSDQIAAINSKKYQVLHDSLQPKKYHNSSILEYGNQGKGNTLQSSEFTNLTNKAIQSVNELKYEDAVSYYKKALKLKPESKLIEEKISLLEDIIKTINSSKNELYYKYLIVANYLFNSGMFANAKKNYELALKYRPGEYYPTERIKEIDGYTNIREANILIDNSVYIKLNEEAKFGIDSLKYSTNLYKYARVFVKNNNNEPIKMVMNFGSSDSKNGGIIIKTWNVVSYGVTECLVKIALNKSWNDNSNNWISFLPLNNDIELLKVILYIDYDEKLIAKGEKNMEKNENIQY